MDMSATNLSAHAKPWAPGTPGQPPQQHQQPSQMIHMRSATSNNVYSQGSNNDGMMSGLVQRGVSGGCGMRGRGNLLNSSGNNVMGMGQLINDYSSPSGMPPNMQQQQPKLSSTAAKLFVGQLPFECTEERLRNLFSAYGNVEHIHILRDNSNRSRGAAFITFSTVQEADTAIFTLHNRYRMLTNRAIQVSYAKNSPNISPFGTCSAFEVHQSNPTNPLPDVAAINAQAARLF
jgi:RNA recognition motif-containing protein